MKRSKAISTLVFILCIAMLSPSIAYADVDGNTVEIGVEWVGQYTGTGSPAQQYGNLNTSDEAVAGLYDIVSDTRTNWLWGFNFGNDYAWERDWKAYPRLGGDDDIYADDVDLVAFCGHGLGNNFVFSTQMDDWYTTISDLDMGDRDCEWMLAFTCNFLNGSISTFGPAGDGVHLICGYCTDMTVKPESGSRFAYWAKYPYGVRVAWYRYGKDTQIGSDYSIARTFGANASYNDYLWGYGSVSSDPPSYTSSPGSYGYWDTKLNW